MNKTEMAQLLTIASAIDNRTVGTETVEAWHMVIGDLDYDDAVEAVRRHFSSTTDYLVPNHIRTICERIARERENKERQERAAAFFALREKLIEEETAKITAGALDADPEKLTALSRGEWRPEWATPQIAES